MNPKKKKALAAKGKTYEMEERLSVVMARKHIERADVVLILIDAIEGVPALLLLQRDINHFGLLLRCFSNLSVRFRCEQYAA
jgi:hypothetical protein